VFYGFTMAKPIDYSRWKDIEVSSDAVGFSSNQALKMSLHILCVFVTNKEPA
jgi:hypothetical protein